MISDLFQRSYDKLDGSMKNRVLDFIMKLQHDPDNAGLDLKIPNGARDRAVRTARVNDNFRAVLFRIPVGYTLAFAGPHDEAAPAAAPVLTKVSAADLGRFGVDADVAAELIRITGEDRILAVAETLPRAQAEAILDLATGRSPDEVWADLVWAEATPEADTSDIEAALARPLSRLSFTSITHSADLQAALEGPFEHWRVSCTPRSASSLTGITTAQSG